MSDALLAHEPVIRLAAFAAVFAIMAGLELRWPARTLSESRSRRWSRNLGLVALNSVVLRFAVPIVAVGAALWAESQGLGLLPLAGLPFWLEIIVAIIVLDLVVYGQHRLVHRVPVLWRLHRTHHIDRDLDVTSGLRFHPLEIVLSMAIKVAAVVVLGASAAAVVLFEVLLNGASLFNHSNLRLTPRLDRALRVAVVTPAMHLTHHSEHSPDQRRNFGFALSLWDRLFGSYCDRSERADFRIGLATRRAPRDLHLGALLADPFRPEATETTSEPARDPE